MTETEATIRWPLSDSDWRAILRFLSPDADRAAVQQAIEAAVHEFIEGKRDQEFHNLCWRITHAARSQQVQEFFRLTLQLRQLEDFPLDPDTEAYLRHIEALVDAGPPKPPKPSRKDLAARYQAIERLRSRFSRAWTDQGQGKMPISATSPFAEFFHALTSRTLPPGLDGEGVKKFVKRENTRRKRLNQLTAREGANLKIEEKHGVYLITASSQRKPN
jgi:hypothetical protein